MSYRTDLGRVRGLGSAKGGVHDWWMARLTSVALVPLGLWFVIAMVGLIGAPYAEVAAWLRSPLNATLMVLFLGTTFYHTKLGIQVIVEDYVHEETAKIVSLAVLNMACVALAVASIIAVLKVAVGG
jgi:succinate dehydrogenase / fumarate reductase, membrane anchor subunit